MKRRSFSVLSDATGDNRGKRLAILFWDGHLGVSPSLIAGISTLASQGYQVDVVLREPVGAFPPPPKFDANRVQLITMTPTYSVGPGILWAESGFGARIRLLANRIRSSMCRHLDRVRYLLLCRRLAKRERYDAIIGVDDDGIVAAGQIAARTGIPLLFWSLELNPWVDSRDPILWFIGWLARRVRRTADVIIVQDKHRARELVDAHNGSRVNVRFVPNAPAGPPVDNRARLFHRHFNLPPAQCVILHAGAISPEMLVEEVAQTAAKWPADWTLVLHERERRSPDDLFLRRVAKAGQGRVHLSLNPVPYCELDQVFASADVSLVLYSNQYGDNFRLIGRASGKLAHSLRVGVPVVCSNLPGLSSMIEEYGCGVVVKDTSEVEDAVRHILEDYQRFRERAWACYRESLEFGRQFSGVLDDLQRLTRGTG